MRWATTILWLLLAACLAVAACADDGESRLIGVDDPEYVDLETPEAAGECAQSSDCEHTCVHSCIPHPTGPFTCPTTPPPEPERIAGAECRCTDQLCAWY